MKLNGEMILLWSFDLIIVKKLGYDPAEVVVGGVRRCCSL